MIFMTPEFEGLIKRELQLRKYELSGLGYIRQKGQFVEAQNLIAYSNELIRRAYSKYLPLFLPVYYSIHRYIYRYMPWSFWMIKKNIFWQKMTL